MSTPPRTPEVHVYRMQYWCLMIAGAVFAQLLLTGLSVLGGVIASIQESIPLDWAEVLLSYAFCSLCTIALMCPTFLLLIYLLPVKVSATSLACPGTFGNMVTVSWDEITGVRPFPIPGFGYLMVTCSGKRPMMWLPLCLRRFPQFVEDVGRFAGPDHALYQALWPRVEQK
jgi:hypothetical protein